MKIKYYLRGFGTGIILATVIMIVALSVTNHMSEKNEDNESQSGNPVIMNAEDEHQTSSETESLGQKGDNQGENTDSVLPGYIQTETESVFLEKGTTDGTQSQQGNVSQQEPLEQSSQTNQETEIVTLDITQGMISNRVAEILQEYGVVEDAYDFNMYLYNNGYESKIKVGTYEIAKGTSYEEIAVMITSRRR